MTPCNPRILESLRSANRCCPRRQSVCENPRGPRSVRNPHPVLEVRRRGPPEQPTGPAGTRGSGGRPQGVRFGLLRVIRRILQRTGLNDRRSRSPGPYFDHHALVPLIIRSRERVRTNGIFAKKEPQRRLASWTPFWILLKWRNGSVRI